MEGCLSVPEHYSDVVRPAKVKVRYLDRDGVQQEMACEGLLATCVQHEIDHLDGILFIDHISALKRNMILRKLLKARKEKEREEAEGKAGAELEAPDRGSHPLTVAWKLRRPCRLNRGRVPWTPQQIELVQTSFKKSCRSPAPPLTCFTTAFRDRAEVRSMFPQDLTEQKKKLMGMLGTAVGSLHKLETILPPCRTSASATKATA